MTARRYEIRVTPEAAKQMRALGQAQRDRLDESLRNLADETLGAPGIRGGKSLKAMRGRRDRFFRLRVGDLRVIFDVLQEERALRINAVLNRRDLERWLRGR
jgi:mRNA-degrading endonuclease RelE of RelBE toxin-antitoxin system